MVDVRLMNPIILRKIIFLTAVFGVIAISNLGCEVVMDKQPDFVDPVYYQMKESD